MTNFTPGYAPSILMDPNNGPFAEYSEEDYWGSSALAVAPMQNLPFFSLCSRGVRFGRPPPDADFGPGYDDQPFTMGYPDTLGGGAHRARGPRIKCQCPNDVAPIFQEMCPPADVNLAEGEVCITFPNYDGTPMHEVLFEPFTSPGLSSNNQFRLSQPWVVSPRCDTCELNGAPRGSPWPADAIHTDASGNTVQLPGWDSRAPLTWVFEHPEACFLVPEAETKHIREWDVFATTRYSDACDYVMTCMYEERSEFYTGKPYWFQASTDNVLFYLSTDPVPTTEVSDGFCFPESIEYVTLPPILCSPPSPSSLPRAPSSRVPSPPSLLSPPARLGLV